MTQILAIDQGTTNSKVLLLDREGRALSKGSAPAPIRYPRPGWVEQDAEAIWRSVLEAAAACLAGAADDSITAIGVTNQRETVLAWDRATGAPLSPCVSWQCQRAVEICRDIDGEGRAAMIAERTGLPLDPMFSAGKLAWLLRNMEGLAARARAGEACLGTVDSWILFRLTNGAVHATDASNASRTLLMNLATGGWDAEIADVFGVPLAALPAIKPSSGFLGESAGTGAIPAGVPVMSAVGDSHAALFGHGVYAEGAVKATYGTGSSLMTLSSAPRPRALSKTVAWDLGDGPALALEGNIFATGAAVEWASRLGEEGGRAALSPDEASPSAEGLYLVPAFTGLGAPYWDPSARAVLTGISFGASLSHVMRAAIEAVAYQIADVLEAMEEAGGGRIEALFADGGASRNDALMQFQADIIARPVIRNRQEDLSAYGAGLLAGLAAGIWKDTEELAALPRERDRFEPKMSASERARLLDGWRDAVGRARMKPLQEKEGKASCAGTNSE